jgi:hypothetical protein
MTLARTWLVACLLSGWLTAAAVAGDEGWVELFDGESLKGWTQRNGTATYRVEDGTIVGKTMKDSPNSFLCTDKEYGDFELEFEVKCHDKLNSGVQIRSQTKDGPRGRVNGPQVEIEASPGEAGYIYGEATDRGWLSPDDVRKEHSHFKNGRWNQYRVVAKGPRIQTWINGEAVADLTDERAFKDYPKGFISLQVHSIAADEGPYEVSWRKIRLRELKD